MTASSARSAGVAPGTARGSGEGGLPMPERLVVEGDEQAVLDVGFGTAQRVHAERTCQRYGESVRTGRDRRKCNAASAHFVATAQRGTIGGSEQLVGRF